MKRRKYFLYTILFVFIPVVLNGQGNDFGIWTGLAARHAFGKKVDGDLSMQMRTAENVSVIEQYFVETGISYKLTRNLSAGGSVRLVNKLEDDDQYHFEHKYYLNIKGDVPVWKFDLSGRLTWQKTMLSYVEDEGDPMSQDHLRFRIKATYDTDSSPLMPFISFEPFFPVFDDQQPAIEKTRSYVGAELIITGKSRIEASYMLEDYTRRGKSGKNVIFIGYRLTI